MKLCALKVAGVPNVGIYGLPLGNPRTKSHLDVALVQSYRVYYKGEGGGFPQVQAVVSLVSLNCPWLVLAPKVLQLCTNHLVLVLCKFVWVIEACQFFLVPSRSSNTPLYPSKVLRVKECASTPCSSVIFNLDFHLSPSKSWERVTISLFSVLKTHLSNIRFWYGVYVSPTYSSPFPIFSSIHLSMTWRSTFKSNCWCKF